MKPDGPVEILRPSAVQKRSGNPRSTLYRKAKEGTFTPPVKLGPRSSGWPAHEVDAISAARVAGKSEDEIRALVKRLVKQRNEKATPRFSTSGVLVSLRDRFAAAALKSGQYPVNAYEFHAVAEWAYSIADAMLAERIK